MEITDSYPEPALGTREEAVKSALKAHRSLDRVRLTSRAPSVTGRALSEWLTWLLETWVRADRLPPVQRQIVRLYFLTSRPDHIQRRYGNAEIARELGISEREVQRCKRAAIDTIAAAIWP